MISIPGYQIDSKIYESDTTIICRGQRHLDKRPVILKTLKIDRPAPEKVVSFRHEYEITHNLHCNEIAEPYSLEQYDGNLAIVFGDFGGESLDKIIFGEKLSLEDFLSLSLKMIDALAQIHANNIIHKDINPSNIVYNSGTGDLKFIDFGIATRLSYENPATMNINVLEGTLAYLSPEQTGRMNRLLDYRTDFYSLGATLYELICRKLPFETTDPLELVYSQIARTPIPPHEIDPAIPVMISNILIKLMSKDAGDRYQSSRGIRLDLETCLNRLNRFGKIDSFLPAQHDIPPRFNISRKLYGREKEINTLMDAFTRVSSGTNEFLVVTGYPGVGKTSIVRELYKPITLAGGFFISATFDPLKRDIPYSAFVHALRKLVRQLLSETDTRLVLWKKNILDAVGPNGQVIIDIIPEVELIIGTQPPVIRIGPVEAENRFRLVFLNFIQVFCRPEHPLSIFLDDLQWADMASINLIEYLMTIDNLRHLFLIGAYRSNEVDPGHPLELTLGVLKKNNTPINRINLSSLHFDHAARFIADSLYTDMTSVKPFADLVVKKTGGNPFFIEVFLTALYKDQLLAFNEKKGCWQWKLERVKESEITDNVVDLLTVKIRRLRQNTRELLCFAACIGTRFDSKTLSIICNRSVRETNHQLQEIVDEGFVLPIGGSYKLIELAGNDDDVKFSVGYRFSHDRIRQVAYSLLNEEQSQAIHWQIGQLLLKKNSVEGKKSDIFNIVNQLNAGVFLVNKQSDRDSLSQLNFKAGVKAKASAAYKPAFKYFEIAIGLIEKKYWKLRYDFVLNLYTSAAEAAYLCGKYGQMEKFAQAVHQNAQTFLDRIAIYEIEIQALKAQYKLKKALDNALPILRLLGLKIYNKPNKFKVLVGIYTIRMAMFGKHIKELANSPKMSDRLISASMRIMSSVGTAAYFANPNLMLLLVIRGVLLSVKKGKAPESAFFYALYGMILCDVVGNIESGFEFGQLAIGVLENMNAKELKSKTYHMVNGFIIHWKKHIKETIKPLTMGFQSGLETGDFEYASFCAFFSCYHLFVVGSELSIVEKQMFRHSQTISQLKHEASYYAHAIYQQTVSNLRDKSSNPILLIGDYYNEEKMTTLHAKARDRTTLYFLYFNKLFLNFLFDKSTSAARYSREAGRYLDGIVGMVGVPLYYFYDSLTMLASSPDVLRKQYPQTMKKVAINQKKMRKWANHAPMNYLHKYHLVEAERFRVLKKDDAAASNYETAIRLAKIHGYIQEEALANELAAGFYLGREKTTIARAYFQDARYGYLRWGAIAKVKDLDTRYGHLIIEKLPARKSRIQESVATRKTVESDASMELDLAAAMEASRAIASEIVLEKLTQRLMMIVMENAGAQTGLLIRVSDDKPIIDAEAHLSEGRVLVTSSVPKVKADNFSQSIVNYVARTRKPMVLNNAATEGLFTTDRFIRKHKPKSILCAPLIHQLDLIGILYLENNLVSNAFTASRFEILKLLSAQIAPSLENARLYADLETSELRYRQLYENIIDMVVSVNPDGLIIMANPCFYSAMDLPISDKNLPFEKFVFPADALRVKERLLTKLSRGFEVKDFQFRMVNNQSRILHVECGAKHIQGDRGHAGYQMVIRDITRRKKLENELLESFKHVHDAQMGTIIGLAKLAEYRDEDTGDHLERIQEYTQIIGEELAKGNRYKDDINQEFLDDIYISSILHDIGKVGIPDQVLLKPSRLLPEEFEIIKKHSAIGGDVLKAVDAQVEGKSFLPVGIQIANYHHERWDGKGYPEGLSGTGIPLSARIVALADVYDALTSKRIYKPAFSHEKAREIIIKERGNQFDPDVVDVFLIHQNEFDRIREKMHVEEEKPLSE